MPDIRHRVGIKAPISEVYDAVATREGLAGWWTRDTEGESKVGGTLSFGFGYPEPSAYFEVVALSAPTRVEWKCVKGPDDWMNTSVTFELRETDAETVLNFTHGDWREPVEFMGHCSTKWATFLVGLKNGLEGGETVAWPNEVEIDHFAA